MTENKQVFVEEVDQTIDKIDAETTRDDRNDG